MKDNLKYTDFFTALKSNVLKPEIVAMSSGLEPELQSNFNVLHKIVTAKDSFRKRLFLSVLEKAVRKEFNLEGKVEWTNIDWVAVITFILKLLIIIAPLFIV